MEKEEITLQTVLQGGLICMEYTMFISLFSVVSHLCSSVIVTYKMLILQLYKDATSFLVMVAYKLGKT